MMSLVSVLTVELGSFLLRTALLDNRLLAMLLETSKRLIC